MEEERIKSALEIAMERISALPELTQEEIAAQKEKQFGPVGEAISARYLSGRISKEELSVELDKHRENQWQTVRRALVASLCHALQLEGDPAAAEKALAALIRIAPGKRSLVEKTAEAFRLVVHKFEQDKQKQSSAIEASALQPLGISGTAVRCNPEENAYWQEELKKIRQAYEPRLEDIRAALAKEISAP